LFVALKGERFDAHDFLSDVAKVPGVAVLIELRALAKAHSLGLSAIAVPNTLLALGELAKSWRAQFDIPLIGVTGSNGKTTVTQMIASVLREYAGERALATIGNLNNDIGVPQTLLRLRAQHSCAVVELGMNHPGEIEHLSRMARPNVALVNNAQREHQEFMNTVDAVAFENGQVIVHSAPNAVAVFPADDPYTTLWTQLCGARAFMTFSVGDVFESANAITVDTPPARKPDVQLLSASFAQGSWQLRVKAPGAVIETRLSIAGEHNVRNALAVIASCTAMGVSPEVISRGLAKFEPVKGRSKYIELDLGSRRLNLVDDTYNANPDSVRAAIDVLASMPGPRLLVLGDMGEVGSDGPLYHAEVGQYAADRGVDALLALGELTRHSVDAFNAHNAHNALKGSGSTHTHHAQVPIQVPIQGQVKAQGTGTHCTSMSELISAAPSLVQRYNSILVKGSRFMKMELLVAALQELESTNTSEPLSALNKEGACSSI
jgi:UDP-N-acetylmuramoyl-tripeptide--D-alanyl-D-alanine ligase